MQAVQDCINDLNKSYFYKKEVKKSFFSDLIFCLFTIVRYEKIFYDKQQNYSKLSCDSLLPELSSIIKRKKLITPDFEKLDVWDINPKNSEKYVIFCPGIATEKSSILLQEAFLKLTEKGFGVAAFDYRGRGKSSGNFSQNGALYDVSAVYNYLEQKGIRPESIGIIGHSMGSGVACDFASRKNTAFTILINPFNSAVDMARSIGKKLNIPEIIKKAVKNLPDFLIPIKNRFNNEKALKTITSPVFMVHNIDDETIPVKLARRLYEKTSSKPNVYYTELSGDDHEINKEKIDICLNFIENLV